MEHENYKNAKMDFIILKSNKHEMTEGQGNLFLLTVFNTSYTNSIKQVKLLALN